MADNFQVVDGNSVLQTFKSKDIGGGIQCTQMVPSDDSGEAYSLSNPLPVTIVVTPTTSSVNSSNTSVTILVANADRKGVAIYNNSTAYLSLSFESPASNTSKFITLTPSAFILFDSALIATGSIYGIWSEVNGTAQVTEFV